MNRIIRIIPVALLVAGCASTKTLTPAERAYMDRVNDMPIIFNLAPPEREAAWQRGLDFISRYSNLPIVVSGENLIETESPKEGMTSVGYQIRQSVLGDSVRIAIGAKRPPIPTASHAEMAGERLAIPTNARILALYMKTGELMPQLID